MEDDINYAPPAHFNEQFPPYPKAPVLEGLQRRQKYIFRNPALLRGGSWDGTSHVFFEPVDFIARLAALVPKPRVNLTWFKHRALVTPGKRGKGRKPTEEGCSQEMTLADCRKAMTWR